MIARMRRTLAVTGLWVALLAGMADAKTYCVSNPACPAGGDTSQATLYDALNAAASTSTSAGADTILLGPGTFASEAGKDAAYSAGGDANEDVTIQGAGPDQTILTCSASCTGIVVFTITNPAADLVVRDLGVSFPPGFAKSGIQYPTDVENVRVVAQGTVAQQAAGVTLPGGSSTLSGLDIRLPLEDAGTFGPVGIGGNADGGLITLRDSSIVADRAVEMLGAQRMVVSDLRLRGRTRGILAQFRDDGTHENTIDDVQIVIDGDGVAIEADATDNAATLGVRHVTVQGVTGKSSIGVIARTATGHNASIRLRNSVLSNLVTSLQTILQPGTTGDVTVSNSVLPPANDVSSPTGTSTITRVAETNAEVAAAGLVDAGTGDLYPRFDSPAIDLANPAFTFETIDLASHARVIDGNGDSSVLPDAGAFEYQRRAPSVTATSTTPGLAGTPVTFAATGSDPDPGDSVSYGWLFSDGARSADQSSSHAFAAGPFSATVTARDPTGQTASSTLTGTVAAPPPVTPPPDTTAPVITGAAFSPRTFRASVDTSTATAAKKAPVGSTLKLTLSEAATVTIVIAEKRSGRTKTSKGKSTCVAETKSNRKAKRCTFYTTRATLTRAAQLAGAHSYQFTGRVKDRALKAGSYRATITATDAAKNASAAATATFTISK